MSVGGGHPSLFPPRDASPFPTDGLDIVDAVRLFGIVRLDVLVEMASERRGSEGLVAELTFSIFGG
jgi:hypothetical protein